MAYTVCTEIRAKAGHEFQYYLAVKHRHIAFEWVRRIGRNPFAFRAYDRALELWAKTVPRCYDHSELNVWSTP